MPLLETLGLSAGAGLIGTAIEAAYNNPKNQIKRLKKAGIHPNAFYELGNTGSIGAPNLGLDATAIAGAKQAHQEMLFAEELHQPALDQARAEASSAELQYNIDQHIDQIKRRRAPGTFVNTGDPETSYVQESLSAYEKQALGEAESAYIEPQVKKTDIQKKEAEIEKLIEEKNNIVETGKQLGYTSQEMEAAALWVFENEYYKAQIIRTTAEVAELGLSEQKATKLIYDKINGLPKHIQPWISGLLLALEKFGGSAKMGGAQININ